MKIIGIIGKQNCGKDVLAEEFVHYGYIRIAISDAIKEYIHQLFQIPKNILWGDSSVRDPRTRKILQEFGTDFARKYDPSIWIRHLQDKIEQQEKSNNHKIVVPDIRFLDEAQALKAAYKTILIKVIRPDATKNKDPQSYKHLSEMSVDQIPNDLLTSLIRNDSDLYTYKLKAKKMAELYY